MGMDVQLSARNMPWIAAALATALALPTLPLGLFSDDYFLLSRLGEGEVLGLYTFADGDAARTMPHVASGPFGWWTDPTVKFKFFRPISELLLALDFRLWGVDPLPYRVMALAWSALAVGLAALVLRRALPPATSGLAALLVAVDESRALPVAWISNRYALTGAALGWLALLAHLEAREGSRKHALISAVALAASLGCGESGLGPAAFLLARELLDVERPVARRARALAPAVAVVLAWATVYKLGGYGAASSGSYVDPSADPLGWLAVAPGRLIALMGALVAGLPADLWVMAQQARPLQLAVGAGSAVALVGLWRGVAPTLDPAERAGLRWLGLGALLALLPMSATFPTDRLLMVPGLAAAAGGAALVRWARAAPRPWWGRAAMVWVLAIQGVLATLCWPAGVVIYRAISAQIEQVTFSPALQAAAGARVIVPAVSSPYATMYVPYTLRLLGRTPPAVLWPLMGDPHDHRLSRADDRTLIVESIGGEMMVTVFEQLLRPPERAFQVGETVRLDGATVRVERLGPGGAPDRVSLTLDTSLDAPDVHILTLEDMRLVPIPRLAVGASVELPWEAGPGGI